MDGCSRHASSMTACLAGAWKLEDRHFEVSWLTCPCCVLVTRSVKSSGVERLWCGYAQSLGTSEARCHHPDTQETVLCWLLLGFGICQKWKHHDAVLKLYIRPHPPCPCAPDSGRLKLRLSVVEPRMSVRSRPGPEYLTGCVFSPDLVWSLRRGVEGIF